MLFAVSPDGQRAIVSNQVPPPCTDPPYAEWMCGPSFDIPFAVETPGGTKLPLPVGGRFAGFSADGRFILLNGAGGVAVQSG